MRNERQKGAGPIRARIGDFLIEAEKWAIVGYCGAQGAMAGFLLGAPLEHWTASLGAKPGVSFFPVEAFMVGLFIKFGSDFADNREMPFDLR